MAECRIPNCDEAIKYSVEFPLCPYHFRQKISIDSNHCLIKLCENERHEAFSFCEKHCDEFFEKEEDDDMKKLREEFGLRRDVSDLFERLIKPQPSTSPLLTDVINSKGLILCSVETMKKILNGGG